MFVYIFDYRKTSGGLWLPAPLGRFIACRKRFWDWDTTRPAAF